MLIEAGLADAADIEFALQEQKKRSGKRIGQILVEMNLVSEVDLSSTLAKKFQLPFVDLDTCVINLSAVEELPRDFIQKHKILPLDVDAKLLTVALSDPLAIDALDQVRQIGKKNICEVVATPSQLERYIPTYLDQLDQRKVASEMDVILKGLAADDIQAIADTDANESSSVKESDNSIIKLANQIVIDGYRRGAYDIHIEPNGKERTVTVRFRVDGDCVAYQEIPSNFRLPLVARFKIMALLDIAERRKPQDGKIRFRVGEKQIELRVATIPTVNNNEDIVLRILAASKPLPIENMGMSPTVLANLKKVVSKLWKCNGCQACGQSGYKGRVALHELLVGSDDLKRSIQKKAPIDEIRKIAAEGGMVTLLQDGVRKVIDGLTDLKQVLAVCSR